MESDKNKLVRLGVKAALNWNDTKSVEDFCYQVNKCQNDCGHDGTVTEDTWYLAVALRNSLHELRNSAKAVQENLQRLERV